MWRFAGFDPFFSDGLLEELALWPSHWLLFAAFHVWNRL